MTAFDRVAIATSIPPRLSRNDKGQEIGEDYQRLAIRSWTEAGMRVLSVNNAEEIAFLAPRFPEVQFIETERDARKLSGRPHPFIADLLSALDAAPGPVVGIVNSDILLDPNAGWTTRLAQLGDKALLLGQRQDTSSLLHSALEPYYWGFDFFFFSRSSVAAIAKHAMPYAIGLPWWDYWLPLAFAAAGHEILFAQNRMSLHLAHPQAYAYALWRRIAQPFATFLSATASGTLSQPRYAPILAQCRALAALPWVEDEKLDAQLNHLTKLCVEALRSVPDTIAPVPVATSAATPPERDPTLAAIFERGHERREAGQILTQAIALHRQRRFAEAEAAYRAVLRSAAEDFKALTNLGMLATQSQRFAEAATLFQRAVEQQPRAVNIISLLGGALGCLGRHGEAIVHFEKAVAIEPNFAEGYHNLGLAQHALGHRDEALRSLERALALNPRLTQAAEACAQIRQEVANPAQHNKP